MLRSANGDALCPDRASRCSKAHTPYCFRRGFHVHFSGANREVAGPPAFKARKPMLRVAGALPVPRGQQVAVRPEDIQAPLIST